MAMVKKTDERAPPEVLEEGHIYFIYRPKVRSPVEHQESRPRISTTSRASTSWSSRTAADSA